METKAEEFIPRGYQAVEAFTFKPVEYWIVRVTRYAHDGRGVRWAVQHNEVIVGELFRTRAEAAHWMREYAQQPVFRVRCREDWGRYVMTFGLERAGAITRKIRAALWAGAALVWVR
jgi:hypothetical protein